MSKIRIYLHLWSRNKSSNILTLLFRLQGDASFLVLCHNVTVDPRDSKHLATPRNSILAHHVDDTTLAGPGKQEIAITLNVFMIINTHARRPGTHTDTHAYTWDKSAYLVPDFNADGAHVSLFNVHCQFQTNTFYHILKVSFYSYFTWNGCRISSNVFLSIFDRISFFLSYCQTILIFNSVLANV